MELQIQELVSSIQKEGIEVAKAETDRIIAEANEKAAAIIAQAKSEAERIEAKSKKEIDLMKDSAKVGAEHAQRDAMLSFKEAVQAKFENLLEADVAKADYEKLHIYLFYLVSQMLNFWKLRKLKKIKEIKTIVIILKNSVVEIHYEYKLLLSLTSQRPSGRDNFLYFFIFFQLAKLEYCYFLVIWSIFLTRLANSSSLYRRVSLTMRPSRSISTLRVMPDERSAYLQ